MKTIKISTADQTARMHSFLWWNVLQRVESLVSQSAELVELSLNSVQKLLQHLARLILGWAWRKKKREKKKKERKEWKGKPRYHPFISLTHLLHLNSVFHNGVPICLWFCMFVSLKLIFPKCGVALYFCFPGKLMRGKYSNPCKLWKCRETLCHSLSTQCLI